MTSYVSKDQGDLDFSVHDPFKGCIMFCQINAVSSANTTCMYLANHGPKAIQ